MDYAAILEDFVKAVLRRHSDEILINNNAKYVKLQQNTDCVGLNWQDNIFVDYQDGRFGVSSIARSVDGFPSQIVLFSDGKTVKRYMLKHGVLGDVLHSCNISHSYLASSMILSMEDLNHDMLFYQDMTMRISC